MRYLCQHLCVLCTGKTHLATRLAEQYNLLHVNTASILAELPLMDAETQKVILLHETHSILPVDAISTCTTCMLCCKYFVASISILSSPSTAANTVSGFLTAWSLRLCRPCLSCAALQAAHAQLASKEGRISQQIMSKMAQHIMARHPEAANQGWVMEGWPKSLQAARLFTCISAGDSCRTSDRGVKKPVGTPNKVGMKDTRLLT